jgi:NO-binding membrane sensor protein with MHYT domain
MGFGTSTMHYVGMAAIRANCIVTYSPAMVAASVIVGVAAATIALRLAFSSAHKPHIMAGAATMGLAISGMHYTAMMAATFLPAEVLATYSSPALSLDLLAIVVAVTAFLISGFFLLVLLPERLAPTTGSGPLATPNQDRDADPVGGMRIPVSQNGTTRLLSHDPYGARAAP